MMKTAFCHGVRKWRVLANLAAYIYDTHNAGSINVKVIQGYNQEP